MTARARLIAAAALVALVAVLLWAVAADLEHRGAEREHAARVQEQQAASAAATAEAARDQRARKDVSDEAQRMLARLAVDRAAAPDVDGRLLDRAREAGRREAAAAAARGPAASDADVVPADLFRSAVAEARRLGDLADERGVAGDACERYADAVTGP